MSLSGKSRNKGRFGVSLQANSGARARSQVKGRFSIDCYDSNGNLKWTEKFDNIVVNEGLNELLSQTLAGGTQITTWYVGLKNTGTPVAADTMGSHGSWTENTTYSNGTRPTWTPGAVASQSVDNSASKANFSINGSTTIFGAFLTSNSTKGGTTGKLYAVGDFASSRAVISGDTLQVQYTATSADDGV